jgi:predicted TIM-barrel fold metal-dependent hydrolase
MKVVDFHVHIGRREDWHPWVNDFMRKASPGLYERFDEIMTPEGLASLLRAEGVDLAVVLAEDCPITTGVVTNEFVAKFCKDDDFFVTFASIHPIEEKDPAGELERCVKDLGFKGLKLYPTYQHFFPNNKFLYPLYNKAQELGIPVMVHTGSSVFKGSRMKYGEPKLLDDVAVDFPDLTLIMAHSGRGAWYDEAFLLATIHPNVYMEVSGLPPKKLLTYFPNLEKVTDKVIFGSDWPGVSSIRDNIEAIKGLGLGQEATERMLGGNALKVLGF